MSALATLFAEYVASCRALRTAEEAEDHPAYFYHRTRRDELAAELLAAFAR